jgi:hypothetical protein
MSEIDAICEQLSGSWSTVLDLLVAIKLDDSAWSMFLILAAIFYNIKKTLFVVIINKFWDELTDAMI